MPRRLALEALPARVVEGELHDVPLDRIGVGARIDEKLARDDRALIEHVERHVRLPAHRLILDAEADHLPRRKRRADFGAGEVRLERRAILARNHVLTRHLSRLHQSRERAAAGARENGRIAGGRVAGGLLGAVAGGEETADRARRALRRIATGGRDGALDAGLTNRGIEPRERLLQRVGLVGDLELEERRAFDELRRALRVIDPRKLDDDPVGADLLDDRLGHAELVDAVAHDLERALDRLFLVRDGLPGFVDLEREVHPTLKVESLLERDALGRVVLPGALRAVERALHDGARPQRPDRRQDESGDDRHPISEIHSTAGRKMVSVRNL